MQTVQPEQVGLSSSRLQRLNRAMQQYIDQQTFAGIITLVAREGQVVHFETYGWQDKEAHQPMAPDTIFRIYSMTKPITSAAVMMLVEEGKVRLSDPVSRFLPHFKDAKVLVGRGSDYDLVPAKREVQVHDLFTHSGGLSYGWDEHSALDEMYRKQIWEPRDRGEDPSLEDMVVAISKFPLASHPGTAFRYSVSIDVLGYIVQMASGLPFDTFLQERIFDPLGMPDTGFMVPADKLDRFAAVYGPAEGGGIKSIVDMEKGRFTRPTRGPSGGGGLVSTTGDYFRFGQMLLNGGELDGARLLGRKTVEWMLQNHLPDGLHPMDEPGNGFGLGGKVLVNPGLSHLPGSVGKFGWGGAANTEWFIDPVEKLQGVIMLQYMPAFTIPIVEDFESLVYQALE